MGREKDIVAGYKAGIGALVAKKYGDAAQRFRSVLSFEASPSWSKLSPYLYFMFSDANFRLGDTLLRQGKTKEAAPFLRRSIAMRKGSLKFQSDPASQAEGQLYIAAAHALLRQKKPLIEALETCFVEDAKEKRSKRYLDKILTDDDFRFFHKDRDLIDLIERSRGTHSQRKRALAEARKPPVASAVDAEVIRSKTPRPARPSAKSMNSAGPFAELLDEIDANAAKANVGLPRGATERAIHDAETTMGVKLPEEVKAYYRRHDGGPANRAAVNGRELLALKFVVRTWKLHKDLLDGGHFDDNDHGEPGKGIRKHWWSPEWIPISSDWGGNHDMIDLAPGRGGTLGQIIAWDHVDPRRNVVGKRGLLAWLAAGKWDPDVGDD